MIKEDFIEILDKYDSDFNLETGETIQAIYFQDFGKLAEELVKLFSIHNVSNCGGGIPYDSLSYSFKKSIDSIEDNVKNKSSMKTAVEWLIDKLTDDPSKFLFLCDKPEYMEELLLIVNKAKKMEREELDDRYALGWQHGTLNVKKKLNIK